MNSASSEILNKNFLIEYDNLIKGNTSLYSYFVISNKIIIDNYVDEFYDIESVYILNSNEINTMCFESKVKICNHYLSVSSETNS